MTRLQRPVSLFLIVLSLTSCHSRTKSAPEAAGPKTAEAALAAYDAKVAAMNSELAALKADPADKEWVKKKLASMAAVDLYAFKYRWGLKLDQKETELFTKAFGPRVDSVVKANTTDLKPLIARYGWIKISEFGDDASNDAAVIVQHSEHDHEFQIEVLKC